MRITRSNLEIRNPKNPYQADQLERAAEPNRTEKDETRRTRHVTCTECPDRKNLESWVNTCLGNLLE